jgi:hypothetical protein
MTSESSRLEWRHWFTSAEADDTKKQLLATDPQDVPEFGQDARLELASIGKQEGGKKRVIETDLRGYLGSLTIEDLKVHVAQQAGLLETAEGHWDQKRNRGLRKTRTNVQRFISSFDRFLQGFSGVVEMARMADDCYGGAATTVLSVFYAVRMKLHY